MPIIDEPLFHTIIGYGVPVIVLILLWIGLSVQSIASGAFWRLRLIERIVRRIHRE